MSDIKFNEDHEWARVEDDDTVVVGITDYAQEQLGELVFIELPEIGSDVSQGDEVVVIESVKAAGELKSPVSGTVIEVNEALADTPEMVNDDSTGQGWFFKLKPSDPEELDSLLDEASYSQFVNGLS